VADHAADLQEGVARARESIDSGAAANKLAMLAKLTSETS